MAGKEETPKCRKKTVTWTNEIIEDLIDFMEIHPIVWNVKDKSYHDKDKRKEVMQEIAEKLDLPEEMIKKKWNALRTQLAQEKAKCEKSRKSGSSPDDVYVTKWIWYEKLMFLWDVIGPKKTVSNLPLPGEVEEQESVESQSIMDSDDQLSDSDISQQLSSTSQSAKKVKSSTVRRKSIHDEEMRMLKSATDYLGNLKSNKQNIEKEDEFDVFGRNIANELRQIKNPVMLRLAKRNINNTIFDAQSDMLYNPSNGFQSSQRWQTNAPYQPQRSSEMRQFGDLSNYTLHLRNDDNIDQ